MTPTLDPILDQLSPPERRAVAIVGLLIRLHGGTEGTGLFSGINRYKALAGRLPLAAERARDIRGFWDLIHRLMDWPLIPSARHDDALRLIAPAADDPEVLRALAERTHSIVMLGRAVQRRARQAAQDIDAPLDLTPFDDPLSIFDGDEKDKAKDKAE